MHDPLPVPRSLGIAASVMLVCSLVGAQTPEDPIGDVALPTAPLLIQLDNAAVRLVVDTDREPAIRWWKARPSDTGTAELSPGMDGGRVVVERPPVGDGEAAARLRVEAVVGSTAAGISVIGSDLDLVVEAPSVPSDEPKLELEPPPRSARSPASALDLQLVRSQVRLTGIGNVVASLEDSLVVTDQTNGGLEFRDLGGEIRVSSHNGPIRIIGQTTSATIEGLSGAVQANGSGGSIVLRSIKGSLRIESSGAQVEITDAHGNATVEATNAMLDIRDSVLSRIGFRGQDSYLTVSRSNGSVTADMTGGSISADGVSGQLNLTSRDSAQISVADHRGDVTLNLIDGSRADLLMVDGNIAGQITASEIGIETAASVTLTATDSWAAIRDITELKSLNANRCQVELDLAGVKKRNVSLRVGNDSLFSVDMPTPCRVLATGIDATESNRVNVTGCELQVGQRGRWATRNVRGVDGSLPLTLTAALAGTGELRVSGR